MALMQEPLTKLQSHISVVLILCVDKSRNVSLPFLNSENSMNTGFLDTNLTDFYGDRAKICMTASALSLSVELIFLSYRSFNTSCTVPSISNVSDFLLLLPLLEVVYQIQPSNVVELQQHSPLSNNTSVTPYVHRMIILPPCLFKHMKTDERVAMLLQCLLDHIQQKLYFCLI